VAIALVGAWVLPLQASTLLDYAADAYNDGNGPGANGAWYGSASYANSTSLSGTVDWAVFTPSQFLAAFGGSASGFQPTPHELVYTYQIINTGAANASSLSMTLWPGPADNIGSFSTLPGTAATGSALDSPTASLPFGSAAWSFGATPQDPNATTIPGNGYSSVGLAYSSPNSPDLFWDGTLIDDGHQATTNAYLATPSNIQVSVPEPSTTVLLAAAAILLGLRRRLFCKQA
jgi:hypothetical protein